LAFIPIQRRGVADQVAEAIRDAIVGGRYRAGEALPGERDLALQFSVNRNSVREALQRLEAIGLVEVRHGEATRVADVLTTAGLHVLPYLIAPGGRLDPSWLVDLLELRVALLSFTAELAAQRATQADLAAATAAVDALAAATDPSAIADLEFDLFAALVAAGRNRVLKLVGNAVRNVFVHHRALFVGLFPAGPVDVTTHRSVVDAIRRGDAAAAREAGRALGARLLVRS